jgi:hypothetical protein
VKKKYFDGASTGRRECFDAWLGSDRIDSVRVKKKYSKFRLSSF